MTQYIALGAVVLGAVLIVAAGWLLALWIRDRMSPYARGYRAGLERRRRRQREAEYRAGYDDAKFPDVMRPEATRDGE